MRYSTSDLFSDQDPCQQNPFHHIIVTLYLPIPQLNQKGTVKTENCTDLVQ